jgi:hypothetical protein
MMNLLFLIFVGFVSVLNAEGPIMSHKDTIEQQEFDNVYKDLRSRISSSKVSGTTTNDNACESCVGYFVSSAAIVNISASASSVLDDVLSIPLTAGDWDVSGSIRWENNGATWTQALVGISTTSGNSSVGLSNAENQIIGSWASSASTPVDYFLSVPVYRISIPNGTTATAYLKRSANFSLGTPRTRAHFLRARRIR